MFINNYVHRIGRAQETGGVGILIAIPRNITICQYNLASQFVM